jgi:hypothetical protein
MVIPQQGLQRSAGAVGFFLGAVLLGTFICADPAAAQCSSVGGTVNTACGSGALTSNLTGDLNSAFGFDALFSNTEGNYNTASGAYALRTLSSRNHCRDETQTRSD